jgi:hypothetical protein
MIKFILTFVMFFALIYTVSASSPGKAGTSPKYETDLIVDLPTAGMLPVRHGAGVINFLPSGGLYFEASYAPFQSFLVGIAYGGNGIIGNSTPEMQNLPGITAKYRFLDERINLPAIAIGFRSQGGGNFLNSQDRFVDHSPGFFLAISKSFIWNMGELSFHSGVNYSFEPKESLRSPDVFFGFEQSIGKFVALNLEFDLTLDEDEKLLNHRGRVNAALRFSIVDGVTLGMKIRDLTNSVKHQNGLTRQFYVDFVKNLN